MAVFSDNDSTSITAIDRARATRIGLTALLVLFSYVFLANAWVGEDAHITFRVVWNFLHGYGLTFNPDERVQAVTHPLWTLVLAAAYPVAGEFFFTSLFLSWAFCLAAIVVVARWARTLPRAAVAVAWLLSSKAFVDYTSSGLEYPLSYLLLTLFYTRYLDGVAGGRRRCQSCVGPCCWRRWAFSIERMLRCSMSCLLRR